MMNNILGTSIALYKAEKPNVHGSVHSLKQTDRDAAGQGRNLGRGGYPQKELEMREYYKIKYTIHGDDAKIRSVILSCVNEDAATANFKMAFIGQSASIVSIEWVPRPGSMVATALAPMVEPAPKPEPEPAVVRRQPIWRQIA